MVTTRSPHVTHAQVAHNRQPRHSVLQLAASYHHIAMAAAKRAAEAAAAAAAKKAHKESAVPRQHRLRPAVVPEGMRALWQSYGRRLSFASLITRLLPRHSVASISVR